jgi:hypothetical protein
MPVTYVIDVGSNILRTTCTNPLRLADVVDHFHQLKMDPMCVGPLDVLLDLRATDFLPESQQLGAVVSEIAAIQNKVQFGSCGIVTANDAMFGMMRMFEVTARGYFRATRVFRSMNEAEAWLAAQRVGDSSDEMAG